MTEQDPSRIRWSFKEDLMPYFGARRYCDRNGLQDYHKSPIGDLSFNEAAANKLIGLYLYNVAILSASTSLATAGGLVTLANNI